MDLLSSRIACTSALAVSLLGCASARPDGSGAREPALLTHEVLCRGDATHPRAELDPACAPSATHELVELVNHLAGCRAGLRGRAVFSLGEQPLAGLLPGERKTFSLPRGEATLTITEGEHSETRPLSLGGSGPVRVEVGCAPQAFVAGGLQPLVLEGPRGDCPGVHVPTNTEPVAPIVPIKVRAGGLEVAVGFEQVQTLFLPRGSYLVMVDGVERTVDIGQGGAVTPLASPCTQAP